MGTFRESIELAHPAKPKPRLALEALVDSGATYTWIPAEHLHKLGIRPIEKRRVKIADGRILERSMGIVHIWVRNKMTPTWVLYGDRGSEPLLGAVTLEELGLGIDPLHRTLVPVTAYLVYFKQSR